MIHKIPNRIVVDKPWSLTEREKDAIDYSLISMKPRDEIYNIFCAPQLTKAQCRSRSSALWSSMDAREYIELRSSQFEDVFTPKNSDQKQTEEAFSEEFSSTLKKLIADKALDPNSSDQWDAIKIAAAQVFKDTTTSLEAPRRYLAESCRSSPCRYLAYCELALQDECKYCKYKKYGEDNGIKYDHKNMLDIPKDDPIREPWKNSIIEDTDEDDDKPTATKTKKEKPINNKK